MSAGRHSPVAGDQWPREATRPGRALLVAGTDTGVGKTVTSVLLLTALRRRGLHVLASKPVESGCDPDPQDALSLGALTASAVDPVDLCRYRLRLPVAPEAAAEAEGVHLALEPIRDSLTRLRARGDLLLVESAGGVGTPCAPDLLVIDLARQLELPVLLVARAVLGTVGQTLVALRLMQHLGVPCLGVVLCQTSAGPQGPEAATHAPLIAAHGEGVPVLGTLPFIEEPMPPPVQCAALREWSERHAPLLEERLDLEQLLARLG